MDSVASDYTVVRISKKNGPSGLVYETSPHTSIVLGMVVAAEPLRTPLTDLSYLQHPAGSLVLLLLGQHPGTHEGHVRIVQEMQAELTVQHGCDQGLHLGGVILEVSAQPACESHQLCQGWASAPTLPQQLQETLHPTLGWAPLRTRQQS